MSIFDKKLPCRKGCGRTFKSEGGRSRHEAKCLGHKSRLLQAEELPGYNRGCLICNHKYGINLTKDFFIKKMKKKVLLKKYKPFIPGLTADKINKHIRHFSMNQRSDTEQLLIKGSIGNQQEVDDGHKQQIQFDKLATDIRHKEKEENDKIRLLQAEKAQKLDFINEIVIQDLIEELQNAKIENNKDKARILKGDVYEQLLNWLRLTKDFANDIECGLHKNLDREVKAKQPNINLVILNNIVSNIELVQSKIFDVLESNVKDLSLKKALLLNVGQVFDILGNDISKLPQNSSQPNSR